MFWHIFKYKVIQFFHSKSYILWIFAFPLMLGTFFYASFGDMMNSDENDFKAIPIALVETADNNEEFTSVVEELSKKKDDQMFSLQKVSEENAKKLLKEGTIDGILYSKQDPTLTVAESGINQTILDSFLSQYLQKAEMIKNIMSEHPEKLPDAVKAMSDDSSYNEEISLTDAPMDALSQYFYALIAMTCMYGSMIGLETVMNIQADLSPFGARREVSPAHKLTVILSEFLASVLLNFASVAVLFFYLIVMLGVDFGPKIPLVLLTGLFGSIIGVSLGTFLGSIGKFSGNVKNALIMGVSMLFSFLSGLMVNDIKDTIEHVCPIINRLNPAALITDCLYLLNIYDTYDRFLSDLALMGIIAALLCFGSFLLLRRNKYASI